MKIKLKIPEQNIYLEFPDIDSEQEPMESKDLCRILNIVNKIENTIRMEGKNKTMNGLYRPTRDAFNEPKEYPVRGKSGKPSSKPVMHYSKHHRIHYEELVGIRPVEFARKIIKEYPDIERFTAEFVREKTEQLFASKSVNRPSCMNKFRYNVASFLSMKKKYISSLETTYVEKVGPIDENPYAEDKPSTEEKPAATTEQKQEPDTEQRVGVSLEDVFPKQ